MSGDRAAMRLKPGKRLVLVGAVLLLAVACAHVEDLADLVEDATRLAPAPTEIATSPDASPAAATPDDSAPSPAPAVAGEAAAVLRIIDGDTFDARLADGRIERIRPPQFDAPERGECWHDEATALLEQLTGGQDIQLIPLADGPDRDRHGRLLRAVKIDREDVGAQMLGAGAARWLDRYAHEDARLAAMYEAAEERTRAKGQGAWTACPGWL